MEVNIGKILRKVLGTCRAIQGEGRLSKRKLR
jgi:hypothetical protein